MLLIDEDSADLVLKSIKSYINGAQAIMRVKKESVTCEIYVYPLQLLSGFEVVIGDYL